MSALLPIGIVLARIPIQLREVALLEQFDGPLLYLLRDLRGHPYLQSWFDASDEVERWLIFRVSDDDLLRYLLRRRTYREILLSGVTETAFVIDTRISDGAHIATFLASVDDLPSELLPNDISWHDPSFRPEAADRRATLPGLLSSPDERIVPIDGTWDYQSLSAFPRCLEQVYGTLFALGTNGEGEELPPYFRGLFRNYDAKGRGYVNYTMLNQLSKSVPNPKRFTMEAVSYSSPGYFRFRGDNEHFSTVNACLQHLRERGETIENTRGALDDALRPEDPDERTVSRCLKAFASTLRFVDIDRLLFVSGDAIHAAIVVRSFHNRLKALAHWQADGRISLLPVTQDEATNEDLFDDEENDA